MRRCRFSVFLLRLYSGSNESFFFLLFSQENLEQSEQAVMAAQSSLEGTRHELDAAEREREREREREAVALTSLQRQCETWSSLDKTCDRYAAIAP